MSDIQQIIDALVAFRDEREWQQFHDTKNLAVALSIEAAELNELFLWKDVAASEEVDKEKIKEELADVFAYALLLAEKQGLDVNQIVWDKIAKNAEKYPVEKARGSAKNTYRTLMTRGMNGCYVLSSDVETLEWMSKQQQTLA